METSIHLSFEVILSFLESLSLSESPIILDHLIDGYLFQKMLSTIPQFSFPEQKLRQAKNWAEALSNNKILLKQLIVFHKEYFHKEMQVFDLDLIRLAKKKDKQQVSKLFFFVLSTVVQSTSKEYFISKLTSLNTQHQQYFMQKIQGFLEMVGRKEESKEGQLLSKVGEVEQENLELRKELDLLLGENDKLRGELGELEGKLVMNQAEMEKWRVERQQQQKENQKDTSIIKKIPKYELKTIENLKQKIKAMAIDHEKQISKYQQQISLISYDKYRITQLEKMIENYKQNYDQAIEHMKEMSNWSNQKYKIMKEIEEKDGVIKELEELTQDSSNKIQQLQQQLLELQISHQKLIIRNKDLQQKLTYKKNSNPHLSLAVDQSFRTLSQLIPQTNQQNINHQLQRQLESKSKKVFNLEKEIEKLKFRVDRVSQVEKEKSRLESLIMEQNQARLDEIELLTSCLYDLRIKYKGLYEETKGKV